MKAYRFVGLDRDVWLPDDIVVEIAIVPSWRTNIRSNQYFTGQTSYTQHETANFNRGANADMHKNWLHGGAGGSYVGFNFVVDDRKTIQLTPLNEVTWTAGTPNGNTYSYHTELCVNADIDHTKARRNAAALAGGIFAAKGWGVDRLVQHNVWWGKDCPYLLRREGRWPKFVAQADDFRVQAITASRGGTPTPTPKPSVGKFKVGDHVITTDNLNAREGQGTNHKIVMTLPKGTKAVVKDGPRDATGYTWYDLSVEGKGSGWAAQDWLEKTTAPVEPKPVPSAPHFDGSKDVIINGVHFHADKRTIRLSAATNVREYANTRSRVIKTLPANSAVPVLGWVKGESVDGNDKWWVIAGGRIWSGTTL